MAADRRSVVEHLAGLGETPLGLLVGEPDIAHLQRYVAGYRACLATQGGRDDYPDFREWLAQKYPETRVRGWPAALLERAGGDHQRALALLAGECAEFVRGPGNSGDQSA